MSNDGKAGILLRQYSEARKSQQQQRQQLEEAGSYWIKIGKALKDNPENLSIKMEPDFRVSFDGTNYTVKLTDAQTLAGMIQQYVETGKQMNQAKAQLQDLGFAHSII